MFGRYSSLDTFTYLGTQIKGPRKVGKADVLIPQQCVQKAWCGPKCSGHSLDAFDPYLDTLLASVI